MLHSPPFIEDRDPVVDCRHLFRGLILGLIHRETDPAEKKARILIAREHGHLTDEEASDWIAIAGLENA